jgi:hypothetical protein
MAMDYTTEHQFEFVDPTVECTKCGKVTTVVTTVVFAGERCSSRAKLWSPAQLVDIQHTLRQPYTKREKPRGGKGKSREDLHKAAPGSESEKDPKAEP